jgi:2-oxoglutarate ferredoxin oxidoreductase subunit beta
LEASTATAPYGHVEQPFPVCELAMAAGASYVARGTAYHVTELDKLVEQAMRKNGFAVVEAVSYCHTTFGRSNNRRTPVENMRFLKDSSVTVRAAEKLEAEQLDGKIVRGVLRDVEMPEFTDLYDQVIERAHGPVIPRKRRVRRGWV